MAITFKQGTTVYFAMDGKKRKVQVNDISASQTYLGGIQEIKTIHNPNKMDRTFSTEKGNVTINISFYISSSIVEAAIFNWVGFDRNGNLEHIINPEKSLNDSPRDLYILSGNTLYLARNCVAENVSFTIAHSELLRCNITCMAKDLEDVSNTEQQITFNNLTTDVQGNFITAPVIVTGSPNLLACTLEITKNISWINQKSVFDIGTMYQKSTPVVTRLSVSGSITKIKTTDIVEYTENAPIQINYGSNFEVYLAGCSITERWDLGTIHTITSDFVLLPNSGTSYLKF